MRTTKQNPVTREQELELSFCTEVPDTGPPAGRGKEKSEVLNLVPVVDLERIILPFAESHFNSHDIIWTPVCNFTNPGVACFSFAQTVSRPPPSGTCRSGGICLFSFKPSVACDCSISVRGSGGNKNVVM